MQAIRYIWCFLPVIIAVNGYKILIATPSTFYSHHQFCAELVMELLTDGHAVTFISPFKYDTTNPNYTGIFIENAVQESTKGELYAIV